MDAETKPPRSTDAGPSPDQGAEGVAARVAALDLVQAGVARRGGFEEALARAPFTALPPRERAFARALAGTTLRRFGALDAALDARLKSPPPEPVRWLLRLGAAQLLYMGVAAHAAVSVTVDQAAASQPTRPFKGLVNAVLRGLARDGAPDTPPETLAPPWLLARWRVAYGEAGAHAIAATIAEEPPTDLSLRDVGDPDMAGALHGEPLPTGGLRTALKGDVAEWPGYAEGRWWVQDAAAALPARLLAVKPGDSVLDLCAAPGGKTLQLAAAGARVTALDRSVARLNRLAANLARTRLEAETVVADALSWTDPGLFDAVLLDAPCSATGTFRRHPDVLWAARPGDVASLAGLQARLLAAAAQRVRPGGRLVYCVCSLEPEEGEAQVAAFLRGQPQFATSPVAVAEAGAPERAVTPQGHMRLLPGAAEPELRGDGFFIARFVRAG